MDKTETRELEVKSQCAPDAGFTVQATALKANQFTQPTQKRFFKTYEKNKGPSSFFVKPAVSDMGDDKKKKFDIFDPVR